MTTMALGYLLLGVCIGSVGASVFWMSILWPRRAKASRNH